jgi:hypothetical protein
VSVASGTVFQKALLLLDRHQVDRGERLLRDAIDLSSLEGDELTRARASCCLGDLLWQLGRGAEAVPFLEHVLSYSREDDLLSYEKTRAKEILDDLRAGHGPQ